MHPLEKWSRGCGSGGLGFSGHINMKDYRSGVLIGNWEEEIRRDDPTAEISTVRSFGSTGTTYKSAFSSQGSFGSGELEPSPRVSSSRPGSKGDLLIFHGRPQDPRTHCNASLNSLTYGEKVVGEPRVQQYLWQGSKKNDMQVPRSTLSQGMINTRRQQWRQQHMQPSQYTSTYKAASLDVARAVARDPYGTRRTSVRTGAEGGQAPTIGRKPVGEMSNHCDQPHLRTGLRC